MRVLLLAFTVALSLGMTSQMSMSSPFTRIVTNYYDVSGKTGLELKRQMKKRGPHGFWAYTQWYVRWSSNCIVNLKITYTYPRLANRDTAPKSLVRSWDRMMARLVVHEEGHGKHGIKAAKEIAEKKCKNARQITKRWAAEDKVYDRRTRHGSNTGVHLPD